ncbi:MAG: hypothetical protein E7663_03180 [Ruminococcaceae bacterium]|nr:hypothetical protein [Oscillospiraceae bacterium]
MSLERISSEAVIARSVESLSNHPGAASRYGTGGLSPTALKRQYDALARLCIDKINELIDAIKGENGQSPILLEIKTAFGDGFDEGDRLSLAEFLMRVYAGEYGAGEGSTSVLYRFGNGLRFDLDSGTLSLDTAEHMEEGCEKPVTSGAVFAVLGDIRALLATI